VLLLSSDGINARNTSAYGYSRDTTPFLKKLSEQSVLFENAFSNSSSTYSSLLSTLTGELPMKMNVLAFPDILIGPSAYQHLPALLRKLGYSTLQLSMRYYADAADANLRYGFQKANFRDLDDSPAEILISKGYALPLADIQFFSRLTSRARSRLSHLIGIQWMDNASQVFTFLGMEEFLTQARTQDPRRISELLSFAHANEKTPWFAQVHLLGTHCCGFFPNIRKYSAGKTQDDSNFTDFYDDAILQADAYFQQIIEGLDKLHQLDNTLIIISSDHGDHWLVREKIPLLIRFPGAKYRGRVQENVQLLDVAPTVMDVLGYKAPSWMSGLSLVPGHTQLNPLRPIFSLAGFEDGPQEDEKIRVLNAQRQPAAYNVILCQKWNTLIQSEHKVIGGDVISHTAPCKDSPLLSIQTGAALLETISHPEAQ
jgi:arylsulfatase A-like enzyme